MADEKQSWGFAEGAEIVPGRTVVEHLGGGRRYEVYLVWDERLLSLAVAKILRPDLVDDGSSIRVLKTEARMLEVLAHPVLLRGFGAVLEGPHPHMLVEYLDGPNLRRLIKKNRALPIEQVAPVALNVAAALHYLSGEGVVHLDVKPANVVMGMPGRLIDLGSAQTLGDAARLTRPFGSQRYMSPEQCDAERGPLTPAADVWGLGATLYHATTGVVPFPRQDDIDDDASLEERFVQLQGAPPIPRDVPALLADLITAMLAHEPSARPAAAEVAEELEAMVDELPSAWANE